MPDGICCEPSKPTALDVNAYAIGDKMLIRLAMIAVCLVFSFAAVAEAGFDELFRTAQNHLQLGQYYLALDDLKAAQKMAAQPDQQAKTNGLLGQTHYRMRHYEKAETFLKDAIAFGSGSEVERAKWLVTWADLQANRGANQDAAKLYKQALSLVGNDQELKLAVDLGLAALLPAAQRLAGLERIGTLLAEVGDATSRSRYYLNLAAQAQTLGENGLKLAYQSLERARQNAGEQQPRLLAESLDGLAQLYEDRQRDEEAMRLTRQGIQAAQSVQAQDLLINLEWRQGRLYRKQKQNSTALAAYQRAVDHIEAIRQDIPVEYHNGRSSFRDLLEPVYLGLADLLLAEASRTTGEQNSLLLHRARDTVELIKQSELADFLGGRCAVEGSKNIALDKVEATTAVLYPILLPDRVEVLVSTGGEIMQFTQLVPETYFRERVLAFVHGLRNNGKALKTLGFDFYIWLIAPAEPWLRDKHVQTLVMVPDGVLRLIPPAALFDGEHYLIERYALATSPGLSMFDPAPIESRGINALLAGISEPGPVVEHESVLLAFETANAEPATSNLPADRKANELESRESIREQLKLPGVEVEIESLGRQLTNTTLMNEDFTEAKFKQQVVAEPYSVVHIASHGVFGNSAANSFLMAYDDIINMDELEGLLRSEKFSKQPVELLTLSACETAEGDDRAPLGISGIALKANVRSAVGSLWPVSDDAAALLMSEFYKALSQPGTSKVQALRQAQVSLIHQPNLENPYFWSPFILVGNWL